MHKRQTRLAVIPARGGSKRLKNKNILPLNGKPLISYTIEAALDSKMFDSVVVSTDNPRIARIAHEFGAETYALSAKNASDRSTVRDALIELMHAYESSGKNYDIVCHMLATCPFRHPRDIKKGLAMLDEQTDSVVAISPFDFPLPKSLTKKGDVIRPYWKPSPFLTGKSRTQDQEVFYHDNGAFYASWWQSFIKYKNFYKGTVKGHEIPALNAIDIDTKVDFIRAEQLLIYAFKTGAAPEIRKAFSHIR